MLINYYDQRESLETNFEVKELVDFLYRHLGKFGDSKEAIEKSIRYAFGEDGGQGGFVLTSVDDKGSLLGVLVMNRTGMSEYIPENVLVYVAVHEKRRGRGLGAELIDNGIKKARGSVKLHVEYDNPAKGLYERLGFVNKYAEMRFNKG